MQSIQYLEAVQDRLISAIDKETKALGSCAAFEKRYFEGAKAVESLAKALTAVTNVRNDRRQP